MTLFGHTSSVVVTTGRPGTDRQMWTDVAWARTVAEPLLYGGGMHVLAMYEWDPPTGEHHWVRDRVARSDGWRGWPATFTLGRRRRGTYDLWSERGQPTAWQLWRAGAPCCPSCTHRSRMWRMFTKMAWKCRWGHVTPDYEVFRGVG